MAGTGQPLYAGLQGGACAKCQCCTCRITCHAAVRCVQLDHCTPSPRCLASAAEQHATPRRTVDSSRAAHLLQLGERVVEQDAEQVGPRLAGGRRLQLLHHLADAAECVKHPSIQQGPALKLGTHRIRRHADVICTPQ